jgi:hypothetical protein
MKLNRLVANNLSLFARVPLTARQTPGDGNLNDDGHSILAATIDEILCFDPFRCRTRRTTDTISLCDKLIPVPGVTQVLLPPQLRCSEQLFTLQPRRIDVDIAGCLPASGASNFILASDICRTIVSPTEQRGQAYHLTPLLCLGDTQPQPGGSRSSGEDAVPFSCQQ